MFAFAVFIAASVGVNAIPPGGPVDPEFETEQTCPEVYGPVESEPADAEPSPWPPGPCYWVCKCEFNPLLHPGYSARSSFSLRLGKTEGKPNSNWDHPKPQSRPTNRGGRHRT